MKIKVKENSGKRLDAFLSEETEYSRTAIQRLIDEEKITVNKKVCITFHTVLKL